MILHPRNKENRARELLVGSAVSSALDNGSMSAISTYSQRWILSKSYFRIVGSPGPIITLAADPRVAELLLPYIMKFVRASYSCVFMHVTPERMNIITLIK